MEFSLRCCKAGVPFIPHGCSAQFYTNLLEKKQLPQAKRPSWRPDTDADVVVVSDRPLKRARRTRSKAKESSDSGETDLGGGDIDEEGYEELEQMLLQMELEEENHPDPGHFSADHPTAPLALDRNTTLEPGAALPSQQSQPPLSEQPEPALAPLQPSAEQVEVPQRDDLLVASGNYGVFRFTRTGRGFSARCPFHRRNPKTDCKKMISVTTPRNQPVPQDAIVMCWRRLAWWCLCHKDFNRQRDHVDFTPPADNAVVPERDSVLKCLPFWRDCSYKEKHHRPLTGLPQKPRVFFFLPVFALLWPQDTSSRIALFFPLCLNPLESLCGLCCVSSVWLLQVCTYQIQSIY